MSKEVKDAPTLGLFWIPIKAYPQRKGIIYESRDGRSRIFIKRVSRSRHFMRKFAAWALDEDIIADLIKMNVRQVYISVKDEGLFMSTIQEFEEHSITDEYGKHGLQQFLNEDYWMKVE